MDEKMAKLINQNEERENARPKKISQEKKSSNLKHWTTFYRRNINLYCSDRLGIELKPFQHLMLYLMNISMVFVAIASRGIGKSFITGLFATAKCMLYPKFKVVVVSSTISQGKIIYDKIEQELCGGKAGGGLSPILEYLYKNGQIKFTKSNDSELRIDFLLNGSYILILPPVDSSRGRRCNLVIYDEFRLVKRSLLESIFEGMLEPRRSDFLNKKEYDGHKEMVEEGCSCYISSSGWKTDWLWTLAKQTFMDSITPNATPSNIIAGDIYLAMEHNLKTPAEFKKQKAQMSDTTFRIEMLNEVLGEAEDSYFKLEEFVRNQILQKGFRLPTIDEYIQKVDLHNRPKKPNEYRIMFIDFAFASSLSADSNDHSVIGVLCCFWENNHLVRNVEYLETLDGGDIDPVNRIKEIYYDVGGIDYVVYDTRNGGDIRAVEMTKNYVHDERGVEFQGFTACNEMDLQVSSDNKILDLSQKAIDPNAIPCLIPIAATDELNSNMWMELKKCMRIGTIRFLINELEFEQKYEDNKKWIMMTSTEKMMTRLPYVQTDLLCEELINLTPTYNNGKVKLSEPRSGWKDRAVALSYGNYIATRLEERLAQNSNADSYDMSDWEKALLE